MSAARDLVVIGTVALLLRALWASIYGRVGAAPHDAGFFEVTATSLANGHGYSQLGQPTAHAPPAFPFIVSLLFRAFGAHIKLALALNVALGAATACLLYVAGRRAMGRAAGLVAGAFFAILPAPIFFTGQVLAESMFVFLVAAVLALALHLPSDRRWTPLAIGVVAGLATLTRGEGVLLLVAPLAMWWGELPRRDWLLRAAILAAGLALAVAPWSIRNAVEMDAFVPLATNTSWALWSGHNPAANGGPVEQPAFPGAGEVDVASRLRHDAVSWAVRHPQKELGLIPKRLVALANAPSQMFPFWFNAPGGYEVGSSSRVVFEVLADALDYLLIGLAIAALVVLGPRRLWRSHRLMRGVLAYLAAYLALFGLLLCGEFRYRLGMDPAMILLATPLLIGVWSERARLRTPA